MENSDAPKTRRPLPTPGASGSQRPTTPVTAMTNTSPVPAASFYSKPPTLPSRSRTHGSNHTAYLAPQDASRYDPPSYQQDSPSFREPELVIDETAEDDQPPDLLPAESSGWGDTSTEVNPWNPMSDISSWEAQTSSGWGNSGHADFPIEGRSKTEESLWWNAEERKRYNRPGPGILAPVLAEELHDTNHSLFFVNVTSPAWTQVAPATPGSSSTRPSATPPTDPAASPPTEEELRAAVPHPNAYYCPKDNGWAILSWKSSSVVPPLARSYLYGRNPPLPDQVRRRRNLSCIEDGDQPFGKSNKTHHFHLYEKAVDSLKLTPPFRQDEWQLMEDLKQRRRAAYMRSDMDISNIKESSEIVDDDEITDEGKLLDLYVCCQCSFSVVASGVISGVIPRKNIDELIRDKRGHPTVGKTPEQSVVLALETLQTAIENKLWKGNDRMIKVSSHGFQTKLGWNPNVKRIFEIFGFTEEVSDNSTTLRPPVTDLITGKANRRKLLRAWVEIGSWLSDFKRIHAPQFKDWKDNKSYVQLDSAREMYQNAVGAHPDQIPRGGLSDGMLQALRPLHRAWKGLGLTPTTYSAELLAFAYLAQCRCDPAGTPKYFTYLTEIVKNMEEYGSCPAELQDLMAMEQSRDRFTLQDIETAATTLGFGVDNLLKVDYDRDVPDDFVESAWKDCIKRSWRDPVHGSETHRLANEAFRILAESRGSITLRRVWESSKNIIMNPDRAYETIEIPKDMDDGMVITVYNMRLEETPSQSAKMRDSLMVIAEVRDSERLRQFIATGQDPGDIQTPTRPDLPRGLNQLGNTCYLNSLLQYFYTIKDLREAVLPMSKLDLKVLEDEKLTDEDLKRHRVGGRLVTRREIVRSRKFVNQLAALFNNLEFCEAAAVTPTIELAKLALITSRDEEEDEVDKGGTDSSHDTEATLVEDGPVRASGLTQSPDRTSTVLGKRSRDLDRQRSEMEVDSPISGSPKEKDGFVFVPSNPDSPPSKQVEPSTSKSRLVDKDGDARMRSPEKPPLPPRRRTAPASDSTMMFGKQHDVAECMDNCMFQIETALLRFGNYDHADKTSVVKRLFYGKIRQRLTGIDIQHSRSSIHEKEDLFSHLPVNVTNDGVDVYDGLSGYFDDVVEFDGKKVRMEMSLVELPPILQIQLQRVQFNRETLQPYKSQAYVKFGENLYMDRFMDNADPTRKAKSKAIQQELNATRDRLRLLVEGKDTPFATCLDHTQSYLQTLQKSVPGIDQDLLQRLHKEKSRIHDEIDRLRAHADTLKDKLEHIWKDSTEVAYELTSVFIHRGSSPSFGHYFFYSRHLPGSPDSWFKYNDSDVSVVSNEEVLADTTGSTANPYLLVFARKGADVVDTVKRFDPLLLDSP